MSVLSSHRFVALMAFQRSGTNMLGWAIHSHPDIHYTGEIFHRNLPRNKRHLRQIIAKAIKGVGAPVICLDTKYNQISPALLEFVEQIQVIHLIRQDDKRHWFSFELRRWWNEHPDKRKLRELPEAMAFRGREFKRFVDRKQRYIDRFSYLEHLRLAYEDLTADLEIDTLPEEAGRAICELAGVEYVPLTTHTLKSAPQDLARYGKRWT